MGFLSAYNTTHRVQIDDHYWVELRDNLSTGAAEKADAALQSLTLVDGKPCPAPDVVKSRQLKVLASIAAWNLDDDNGTVWPINMQSVRRLPDSVFSLLLQEVEASNAPATPQERRQFPDGGVGGDPDGDGGSADPAELPDRAGAVEAPGTEA